MKPYIPILIVLMLVSASFVGVSLKVEKSSTVNSDGNTLYVGGSGEGNYTKIQDAINDANPGDTVFVYAYSSPYYENIVVNKSITLIGEDRNTTIIDGKNETVIRITASWVYLSGFTIQEGYHGVDIWSEYNTITNNTIVFNKHDGIETRYSNGNNIIAGNDISINSHGIVIWESNHNVITCNTISENSRGIDLYYSSNNTITGNSVIYNKQEGVCLYDDNHDNIISSNFISNNGMYGISLWGSNSNRIIIKDNTISFNYELGINLVGYNNNIITGNNIIKNGYAALDYCSGIFLFDSSNNTITGNNIRLNHIFGIQFRESSNNNISENNFLNNILNAFLIGYCKNIWTQNYWNRPRVLPKLIIGKIEINSKIIPWFNIDWRPALRPYDI